MGKMYQVQNGALTDITPKIANVGGAVSSNPVGTLIWFAGSSAPSGYLLCDGSAMNRSTYADLFAVIGTTYGAGDGSTTFNLPNLIGKFIEGAAVAGTEKAAGLPNVIGEFGPAGSAKATGAFTQNTEYPGWSAYNSSKSVTVIFDASKSNAIYGNSTTVQPPALTALPCIKYTPLDSVDYGMAHAAMPSERYDTMVWKASGDANKYTAPADGYIYAARKATSAGQYLFLDVFSANDISLYADVCFAPSSNSIARVFLPISKGFKYSLSWSAPTEQAFVFVYANGAY